MSNRTILGEMIIEAENNEFSVRIMIFYKNLAHQISDVLFHVKNRI